MPPRALPSIKRIVPAAPQRPATVKVLPDARKSQVLQSSRAPAQLSLFLRPVGAR